MLQPGEIPRIAERLVMDDLWNALGRLSAERGFNSVGRVAGHVLRIVWSEQLHGRASTAHRVAKLTGMPRTTVMRKLASLVRRGVLAREDERYCVADWFLLSSTAGDPAVLDEAIKLVLEAADALRRARR